MAVCVAPGHPLCDHRSPLRQIGRAKVSNSYRRRVLIAPSIAPGTTSHVLMGPLPGAPGFVIPLRFEATIDQPPHGLWVLQMKLAWNELVCVGRTELRQPGEDRLYQSVQIPTGLFERLAVATAARREGDAFLGGEVVRDEVLALLDALPEIRRPRNTDKKLETFARLYRETLAQVDPDIPRGRKTEAKARLVGSGYSAKTVERLLAAARKRGLRLEPLPVEIRYVVAEPNNSVQFSTREREIRIDAGETRQTRDPEEIQAVLDQPALVILD